MLPKRQIRRPPPEPLADVIVAVIVAAIVPRKKQEQNPSRIANKPRQPCRLPGVGPLGIRTKLYFSAAPEICPLLGCTGDIDGLSELRGV